MSTVWCIITRSHVSVDWSPWAPCGAPDVVLTVFCLGLRSGLAASVLICSVASDSLRPRGLEPTRLLCPWDSPWTRILEQVAISYSRGSSRPRDRTRISCIGRQILYPCATWEVALPHTPLNGVCLLYQLGMLLTVSNHPAYRA